MRARPTFAQRRLAEAELREQKVMERRRLEQVAEAAALVVSPLVNPSDGGNNTALPPGDVDIADPQGGGNTAQPLSGVDTAGIAEMEVEAEPMSEPVLEA